MYKNRTVIHKKFGKGIVKSIINGSSCRFIIVRFNKKEAQFVFPDAFENHLRFEDEALQAAVIDELHGRNDTLASIQRDTSAGVGISNTSSPIRNKNTQRQSKRTGDSKTGIYILNFQAPSTYDDLLWFYEECDKKTNLEFLIEDAKKDGETGWSVPTYAETGDTVIFMLASSSIDTYHLNGAINETAALQDWTVYDFGIKEREKYKKYAGKILCIGKIINFPSDRDEEREYNQRLIMADIGNLQFLENPVPFKEFRDFISINRFGSVTGINRDQWIRLKELLKQKNPGLHMD